MATKLKYQGVEDQLVSNSLHRQAIINGNFDVWQRGTSFSNPTGAGFYTSDRWQSFRGLFNNNITISRQTAEKDGSSYAIRVARTAGDTQTTYLALGQSLEDINSVKLRNKILTLSFEAKVGANFSASNLVAHIAYSNSVNVNLPTSFGAGVGTVNIPQATTTKTKFTVTGTAIPATANTVMIYFTYTPTGTAGANDWFEIEQVQLCAGDVALPFMPKSFDEELRACQRYFEIVSTNVGFCGNVTSGTEYRNYVRFYAIKRTSTPTITWTSNAGINGFPNETVTFERINSSGFVGKLTANASISGAYFDYSCTIDAEL